MFKDYLKNATNEESNIYDKVFALASQYNEGYKKYDAKYGSTEEKNDAFMSFEIIYTTMTDNVCNTTLVGSDNASLSICRLGADLQYGAWTTNPKFKPVALPEEYQICNEQ